MLNIVSIAVRVVRRVELEPAINNPHLASSLQDFWGKRWNLMVTNILRLAVYDHVRLVIVDRIPRKWAPIPAVLATFFVSGLMHELFFYYIGRLKPSGEAMMFFLIHGVALSVEIAIKKMFNGKFLVPRIISGVSRVELEPPFDEPYLASSLQDFWGKRWNLMVTNILRPTVYDPVRSIVADRISRKWAPLPAVLATFFVSGLMHELIFNYNGRLMPNGEYILFFLIHGVALSVEIVIKKISNGKFFVPRIISCPLALAFIFFTSCWMFFPSFLRGNTEFKACSESIAFFKFIRYGQLISPTNITCPLL
uniref:Acyltransferase n=1 Tax=Solanum tuberosum TaxID=4113 RepID=M1B0V4_SOLTU